MICGIWLLDKEGNDAAKIDLSPGLGSWRVQHLQPDEYIIGYHYYVHAEDEDQLMGTAGQHPDNELETGSSPQ